MSVDVGSVFTLRYNRIIVSTAITILQVKAGAANGFQVTRAWISQGASAVSATANIALLRKSSAATVTAAALGTTLFAHDPATTSGVSLGTTATGYTATSEGTDSDEIWSQGFNTLIGALYLPTPEERIFVPPGGIIALKFTVAPASATWTAGITFKES